MLLLSKLGMRDEKRQTFLGKVLSIVLEAFSQMQQTGMWWVIVLYYEIYAFNAVVKFWEYLGLNATDMLSLHFINVLS